MAMPRRKKLSDEQVLDAILPEILRRGLQSVTLPELGEVVGLSPATLLQRFGSRTGVIEAALDRTTDALELELQQPLPGDEEPLDGLIGWLVRLAEPVADRELLAGSLEILGRDIVVPERNAAARRHLGLVRQRIERALVASGRTATAARWQGAMVEAHWHGLSIQWALHGEGPLDGWMRDGLRALLQSLPEA